jgi:hypothetical protein
VELNSARIGPPLNAVGQVDFFVCAYSAEVYREQIDLGLGGDPAAAIKARTIPRDMLGEIMLSPGEDGSLWAEYGMQPAALLQGAGTCGRGDRTRTCDLLVPNQTLYQAELRPEYRSRRGVHPPGTQCGKQSTVSDAHRLRVFAAEFFATKVEPKLGPNFDLVPKRTRIRR